MKQQYAPAERNSSSMWLLLLFSLTVAAYCLWVLSLPVFPSQDGPLHLYYAKVFGLFLAHSPGIYAQYYRIGSYLPPYALYYYLLISLNKVVSLTAADKIIVCCSIVLNAFGFRYLTKRVGPGGEVAAFLSLPLTLNWPLVMGFVNFTLSCGLGWFAAGLWARFDDGRTLGRKIGFVILLYLMTLTHPLPLAILLVVCAIDLGLRFLRNRSAHDGGIAWRALLPRVLCLAAAAPAALYIRRFTVKNMLDKGDPSRGLPGVLHNAALFARGAGLFPVTVDDRWTIAYRIGMYGLVLATLSLAALHALQCWRVRQIDGPTRWLLGALVAVIALPLMPHDLNGSHFISHRFAVVVYLFVAMSVSGIRPAGSRAAIALVAASMLLSLAAIGIASQRLGAAANRIADLIRQQPPAAGTVGILLQTGDYVKRDFTYQPFMWAGVHYFRQNSLVLYNSAWLDGPQIPLKPNEQTNLLEPTQQQRVPDFIIPASMFLPGARWNPPSASFYVVEKMTPKLKPEEHSPNWEQIHVQVSNLKLSACNPQEWFCIAPRK